MGSLIVFDSKPQQIEYPSKTTSLKKSVIFYCSGQMGEYSPLYASEMLKSENTLLKPFYAMKLKAIYRKIDLSHQNDNVLKVASELKNSLLRNYPYYFYIAYSNYTPDLFAALQASINDGCSSIQILNYSYNKLALSPELSTQLKRHKISIEITPRVYTANNFPSAMTRIIEASTQKNHGILLLGNVDDISEKISSLLVSNGYLKQNILIKPKTAANITAAFHYFENNHFKNIFYINLTNDNFDYKTEILLQSLLKKQSTAVKITGVNSWSYNKFLIRAAIEVLRNKQ